ncbi:beta-galactoside alpha-2,6-sialyltransferase 2b [Colossoma macropomum]|uniref:beta-galactoside alpha-2,6-sialyltransferase 2b n=1 Tax=Colossoma macropomum TaxID=42526 RepID=UPI0018646BDE|nr:beta-galactoside alpha-2,6-sialyltransferase 2b [Colossoma macropomum]
MKLCCNRKLLLLSLLVWILVLFIVFSQTSLDSPLKSASYFIWSVPAQHSFKASTVSQGTHSISSQHTNSTQASSGRPVEGKGRSRDVGGKRHKLTPKKRVKESEDGEEYFSNGRKVVYGLWMGLVSSKMLSVRLQKAKKANTNTNKYSVTYVQQQSKQLEKKELLCQLKQQVQVRTLDGAEEPFASLGWKQLVPSQPLLKLHGTPYKTCAAVCSAGAILKSSLGKEIDSHDAVVRFNSAPTEGYDNDVGNKTTIRLVNSKVMGEPEYNFNTSSLYKNVTLVAWDASNYSSDLHQWYKNPDFDLFTVYKDYRTLSPEQPFYILHPEFIWSLWKVVQANTNENIQTNPPSSGFIGIALMMGLCEQIDVYEFIPSKRHTTLCHYYTKDRDMACTLGAYHPLLFEKLLVRRMTTTSHSDFSNKGKVTLPGFSKITCPP